MDIIYSDQDIIRLLDYRRESIFLAGPTPRSKDVMSWRPKALEILDSINFEGQVLVPERSTKVAQIHYEDQVEWEFYGLEHCNKIVIWVPRDMATMPALTTNVEFGRYVASGRVYYGRPDSAEKCRYLDWLYKKFNHRPVYTNLEALLNAI